ncbi:MAG: SusC/RagA family TonB-linked outer membrane protein [Chitinophagaceae bacterium]|nr:SusC/RagA family TonB-linked outer membrane protein [Chitinophagaceae bacterium]
MTLKRLFAVMALPVLVLFFSQAAYAQDKTVTGKVTDSKDGSGVPGVSVTAKGSRTGTQTGADGSFRITVASSVNTLVFSAIGFTTQEVSITGSEVNVSLVAATSGLSEVVVVGYGTARKKDLTGSVASVKAKDFNQGVFTAPDQLIQGKVAGVQIISNTGAPGGASTIRIRGISSIRSGNQPLFVVDGVPLSGGSAAPGLGTSIGDAPGDNPLNFINPNDIASIDVQKDASATAIYGSRGANGVIIITTKRGQTGAPKVEFSTSVGVNNLLRRLDVLTGDEYRKALQDYSQTGGNFGTSVDALDAVLRTSYNQNYNMAITGGNDNGRYRISTGYLNQEGIVKESGFKKYSASLTSSFKFLESKRLGVDFNVLTTHTATESAPISNNAGFQGSLIGAALQYNPTASLNWTTAQPINPALGATTINPLALLAAYDDIGNLTTVLASIAPSFKITNDLTYRMLYSVNYKRGERRAEIRNWINYQGVEGRGVAAISNNRSVDQQVTHTLNYIKAISSSFRLDALVGYEYLKYDFKGSGVRGTRFVDYPGIKYTDYLQNVPAADREIFSFADPLAELQSYFARATVNFRDKINFTVTVRRDGSSKFGVNNRYGTFPSAAASWNINDEEFLKNSRFINTLKLRVSWGRTGNQEFPTGASKRVVSIGQGVNQSTVNYPNPDVKWETNTLTNAGLDFAILDSRITGSLDYYTRKTTDALFQRNVTAPGPSDGRYWTNLPGSINNSGFEIALNGAIIRGRDLNWNMGVNLSFQKNELKDFVGTYETGTLNGQGSSGATVQRLASGYPLNVYYLRKFEGLDKATGQSIYTDDGNTLFYFGSPNPKTVVGFTTDLTYKKWSLVVNMNGAYGHYLYNETNMNVVPIGNLGTRNISKSLLGGGVKEALSNPIAPSSRFLEKGDYIKLANATISYRLGDVAKTFKGAVVSLTGQNLFVLTDFTGFDPEVNVDKNVNGVPSLGIEYIPYPRARTIQLSLTFSL